LIFQTAIGVSANYDAIVDLFECVGNFLGRLGIYAELPMSPPMNELIIKIMVEVLSVLSLATKQIKLGRFSKLLMTYLSPICSKLCAEKFSKKLLGESEIEAVLQRLDRLTLEESRTTTAQTFEVVHGLVHNMRLVMDSTQPYLARPRLLMTVV
jgi:hypothetical protein